MRFVLVKTKSVVLAYFATQPISSRQVSLTRVTFRLCPAKSWTHSPSYYCSWPTTLFVAHNSDASKVWRFPFLLASERNAMWTRTTGKWLSPAQSASRYHGQDNTFSRGLAHSRGVVLSAECLRYNVVCRMVLRCLLPTSSEVQTNAPKRRWGVEAQLAQQGRHT